MLLYKRGILVAQHSLPTLLLDLHYDESQGMETYEYFVQDEKADKLLSKEQATKTLGLF